MQCVLPRYAKDEMRNENPIKQLDHSSSLDNHALIKCTCNEDITQIWIVTKKCTRMIMTLYSDSVISQNNPTEMNRKTAEDHIQQQNHHFQTLQRYLCYSRKDPILKDLKIEIP